MSFRKIKLRLAKWSVWMAISIATGGAWIFYFTDAPTLATNLLILEAHPVAYSTIAILSATTFVFGGFMREQVCIYMCPWPRIQAAMMDESSLTVGYRDWRGEPRGKHRKAAGSESLGDCIDCEACVNVCPMGIDIRDGQQLACINCALCIDACDDVMQKIGKPRGLVDYMRLSERETKTENTNFRSFCRHVLRPRVLLYAGLWAGTGAALVFGFFVRPELEYSVAPIRNPIFVTLSDGSIRNTYDFRIRNRHGEDRPFLVFLDEELPFDLRVGQNGENPVFIAADSTALLRVHVTANSESTAANAPRTDIGFWVEDGVSGDRAFSESVFNGDGG